MRIVLNGWFLVHDTHTGTGQYLRALLAWLPQVAPQHTYHVILPAPVTAAPPACELRIVPCGTSNLDKLCFEQFLFPSACRALQADLVHVPYWAPPLVSPAPVVVTIHDLIPRLLPEYRGGPRVRLYTALVSAAASGAALILADSETTRHDILRELEVPPERVRTVYLAADARYTPVATPNDAATRRKYTLPESYVLYLGGFDARKNVPTLLHAWTLATAAIGADCPLVIAGQLPRPAGRLFADYPRLAAELRLGNSVKFIGPIDEADKPALYRGAAVFVYPSRYEGFGLPPLEAMACGVPVVAANGGSLGEIIGNAGYLLHPDDARSFGAAILACRFDRQLADQLRTRGLIQAKQFSWERTAWATAAAYAAIA